MKDRLEQDVLIQKIIKPTNIPEFINTRIDDTLNNIENRKKKYKVSKKTVVIFAACISIMSIGTFGAFAQDLPVIKSLVMLVNPSAAQNYEAIKKDIVNINNNAADANKTGINKSVTNNGITLSVNDMSYDGATLIVGFDVSKQGGFYSSKDVTDVEMSPYFGSIKNTDIISSVANVRELKDKIVQDSAEPLSVSPVTLDSYSLRQENGNYKGYASFYFGDQDEKIQDNYTLTLRINEIDRSYGPWEIDTGITKKDIYTAADIKQSNDKHQIEYGQVDSIKVTRSALNNIISLKGIYRNKTDNMKMAIPGFFILDNNGKCLNYKDLNQGISNDEGAFISDIGLMDISKDTKKLTVIPYKRISSQEKYYTADITKLPASIKIQDGEIKIIDIERSSGELTMKYIIDGLTDSRYSMYFDFVDRNGNRIDQTNRPAKRVNHLDYETGIGAYALLTDKSEDTVKVICAGFDYELMSDYKFDVTLE